MAKETLRGSADTQLDEKNRIRVPTKFTDVFRSADYKDQKLYFVIYVEGRISMMAESVLNAKLEPFENIPPDDLEANNAYSKISETIEGASIDGQGRVTLPKNLRLNESIKIDKDVFLIGKGDFLEIWSKEIHDKWVGGMSISEAIATASRSARANRQ